MSAHRVSVVIPTRNRLDKLRRALASVDRQSYRDFEVWLVDDGSSDGTGDFLGSGELTRGYPNIPSIHVLTNEVGGGAAAARNRALKQLGGDLIAFLDDDDVWLPEFLARQVAYLDRNPGTAVACAPFVEVDAGGRSRQPDLQPLFHYASPLIHLLTEAFVHTMSILVCRRSVFTDIGLLDERLRVVHDWEWYARLLLSGAAITATGGTALVGRDAQGGLVSRHRDWYREERHVLERIAGDSREVARALRQIRAHRALLFARIALRRGDTAFAAVRLGEALWTAPLRSLNILFRRLSRNACLAKAQSPSDDTWSESRP